MLFSAMVSYNVVVGDTITKVLYRMTGIEPGSLFARREFVVLVSTLFITVPLCLYRDIAKLAKISFVSLICVALILVSIFIRMGSMHELMYVIYVFTVSIEIISLLFQSNSTRRMEIRKLGHNTCHWYNGVW